MQKLSSPESQFPAEGLFDETTVLDVEYFIKTLSGIIDKGVRPDLIGSIITHYASKWLPDLSSSVAGNQDSSPAESPTNTWMKKRAFVEKLVGILPQEKDAVPCNFLLRLLRAANMVEAGLNYRDELEKRVACQLDQASLNELMIPSYNHTCETLLDVDLVIRIVRNYVGSGSGGGSLIKVAKLIDSYLAEVAVDSNLLLPDFITLAGALPEHSRSLNDGLYRAIDTYLKAHPSLSKEERKRLCRLLDSRKLSPEATLHATHNYRLPVRAIIQILLSEQTKLTRQIDWSGSFSGTRSPNMCQLEGPGAGPGRCQSKRESIAQQMEIKKLREDMLRLQKTCISIQAQMEKLLEKKKGSSSYFSHWKKLGSVAAVFRGRVEEGDGEREFGRRAPSDMKMKVAKPVRTPHKWRKSVS
ncbi:root phototropism protein 3-like [Impatiens glandulifera]|uniref:root phototropism protein 3-like n=1 Tax=Impatiens glandulifera TaxID=253017 RepID=UPI001FB17EE7|nr:root phototropism protein 3-like [Impatiens glandulifera]